MLSFLNRHRLALCSMLATALTVGMSEAAMATGPTYDITPVTTSITSELTANLPVILAVIGALIALAVAVRAVRKFVKV